MLGIWHCHWLMIEFETETVKAMATHLSGSLVDSTSFTDLLGLVIVDIMHDLMLLFQNKLFTIW